MQPANGLRSLASVLRIRRTATIDLKLPQNSLADVGACANVLTASRLPHCVRKFPRTAYQQRVIITARAQRRLRVIADQVPHRARAHGSAVVRFWISGDRDFFDLEAPEPQHRVCSGSGLFYSEAPRPQLRHCSGSAALTAINRGRIQHTRCFFSHPWQGSAGNSRSTKSRCGDATDIHDQEALCKMKQ
jgi:hypothetical protein